MNVSKLALVDPVVLLVSPVGQPARDVTQAAFTSVLASIRAAAATCP